MDKYVLLFALNVLFVFFGLLKAIMLYRTKSVDRVTFALRVLFWISILLILIFAHPIYDYAYSHNWTDSSPLSLPDVVLATGFLLSLSLCVKLYAKVDVMDKRISDLHQEISILRSLDKKD